MSTRRRVGVGIRVGVARRHARGRVPARSHARAATHLGGTMTTLSVIVHLVPVHLGVGGLHLHQLARNAEVLQRKDLLSRLGRIEGYETEPTAFLGFLVVENLNVLDFPVFLERFLYFISKDITCKKRAIN